MAGSGDPEADALLEAAAQGDRSARGRLLERHRPRLVRMVELRLDRRLAARLDPTDIVQEALMDATAQLDTYLRDRPIPLYPWLRRLAWERTTDAYRRHVVAGRRSVDREDAPARSDESVLALAERLLSPGDGPSTILGRVERREKVRIALNQLPENDREILLLRYLEDLSTTETAAVLGASEAAVKVRLYRAMKRLRDLLDKESLR